MGLYENVKEAAKNKGYSINRLEKELGFARSYIGKFKTITPGSDLCCLMLQGMRIPKI